MKRLEKGFTLIELMIVVAIIAILAAVAAPKFGEQIKKSKDAKGLALVGNWRSASQLHYSDDGIYATGYGQLVDNVDDTTVNSTFTDTALSTKVTSTSGVDVYVAVGTATTNQGSDSSHIAIKATYNASTGAISLIGGNDTKTTAWADK